MTKYEKELLIKNYSDNLRLISCLYFKNSDYKKIDKCTNETLTIISGYPAFYKSQNEK